MDPADTARCQAMDGRVACRLVPAGLAGTAEDTAPTLVNHGVIIYISLHIHGGGLRVRSSHTHCVQLTRLTLVLRDRLYGPTDYSLQPVCF